MYSVRSLLSTDSMHSSTRVRIKVPGIEYLVPGTRYVTTAVSGIYRVRYTYTSKDTALLFCFNARTRYSVPWVYNVPSIRNDRVLLWSTPQRTRFDHRYVAFFQNYTERYVRQLTCKRLTPLDDRA